MSREWKPGDVAMVHLGTEEHVAIHIGHDPAERCWHSAYSNGDLRCTQGGAVTVRPLVVIDPEDMEAVERLLAAYNRGTHDHQEPEWIDAMAAALREFANPTPPKPDEPQGDGAVVEDAMGNRWVRIAGTAVDSPPWRHRGHSARWWDSLSAVRILSPGVES